MKKIILISFLCLFSFAVFSQKIMVERFRVEDGLPSDIVKSLAMDSAGFIWVGTDDGIAKLQGKDIIKVVEPKLISDNYKDILLTRKYGLLASVDGGLLELSQNYKSIYADFLNKKLQVPDSINFTYIKTLYESKDSSIWFSNAKTVFRIKNKKVTVYNFPTKSHTENFIRSFQFLEIENHFMVFSEKGYLYELNKTTNTFVEVAWKFEGVNIYDIHKINNEKFLIACSIGLLQMNCKNGTITNVTDLQCPFPVLVIEQLSNTEFVIGTWYNGAYKVSITGDKALFNLIPETKSEHIPDILIDKEKQIWLATSSGIYLIRNIAFNFEQRNPFQMPVLNIVQGADSLIYCNVDNAVYRTSTTSTFKEFYTTKDLKITSIAPYKNGLLIGTSNGNLIFKDFYGKISITNLAKMGNAIYGIIADNHQNIWLLQQKENKNIVLKIDNKGNISEHTPKMSQVNNFNFIKLSPSGDLYIGAALDNSYLFRYNEKKQKFINISLPFSKPYAEQINILDMAFGQNNTIFLATTHGILKQNNKTVERYNLGYLAEEVITAITIDSQNRMWFSTIKGLVVANNSIISVYNNADGLASKVTNIRCLLIDSHNYLWVSSNILQACKIPQQFKQSSKPIITSIKHSGEEIEIQNPNEFLQNTILNIFFASPDYSSKYIQYQYSLNKNNAQDIWIDIKNGDSDIIFDNLEKGNYTLKIRAKNKGHYTWSEPTIYIFSVYKIWYTRPEIIIGINLILLILIYFYFRFSRIKNLRKQKELEEIIAQRTQEIVAQNVQLVKTQKQLIQSEKMASIGLLAAGIAHEINNPINYINGGITVLKKSYAKLLSHLEAYKKAYESKPEISHNLPHENQIKTTLETTNDMFNTIEDGIQKTKKIVEGIRTFSSNSENNYVKFDINESINSVLLILLNSYKNRITIEKDYAENVQIVGVPSNVQQIFMNILANAIQAIENKGTIWIKTSIEKQQNKVTIKIKDSGSGMSEEVQSKIFDPFYTTKDVGNGTGLGLYLTYQYVEQHFGKITVHSQINKGTEFIITLPITH